MKRWSVIAVGVGWPYREATGQTFVTRWGARRFAADMNSRQGFVPLRMIVERLP